MIAGVELFSRVGRVFKRVYKERPQGLIQDWGRLNIELSSDESGDFPGPYDPDINPLPTVVFDAYQAKKYKKAVFKKSSQSGVTLAVLILICWYVTYECKNFLYILDSIDEMRRVSKTRLKPMLLRCKAAGERIPEDEDDLSNLTYNLLGSTGYLGSSNSLAALSNKSVGLAVYDEVDGYRAIKGSGEKATDLGKERGKAQATFFEILLGKPIDWDDTINQEYLIGTRHKCNLPCPHCGTKQELEWEQLQFRHCRNPDNGKWDTSRLEDEIYYECKFKASDECRAAGGKILESHKADMVRDREWIQTHFGEDPDQEFDPEVFSCEITDLYSTRKGSRWHDLAKEWIHAQGDNAKMQTFLRGRLARPRKSKKIQVATNDIWKMTLPYARGHLPVAPDVVIMASDVQQVPPVKKWCKVGFRLDSDAAYVIDWGENLAFGDLTAEMDKEVIVDKWDRFTPAAKRVNPTTRRGFIDERHERDQVREFVISTLQGYNEDGEPVYRWNGVRGWGGMHERRMRSVVTPLLGEKPNVVHNGYPLWVYDLSDDDFKDRLYNQRINRFKEIIAAQNEGRPPPSDVSPLHFPQNLEAGFVSELCQERFVKMADGTWGWQRPKAANDWGDALKYCLVGWYLLRPVIAREKALANLALAR